MEYQFADFELKEVSEAGHFSGYGSVYNNVDRGGDTIMPGAFKGALEKFQSGKKPKMLWQHDPANVIGVWDAMKSDDRGLKLEGRLLTDIGKAKEVHALMKAGALDGLSIGYKALDYDYETSDNGRVRKLKEIELWEVSVVTFPMNAEATVTDVKQLQTPRDVERLLRKAGVPGTFAKLVSLHGFEEATNRLTQDHRDGDEAEAKAAIERLLNEVNGLKEIINA